MTEPALGDKARGIGIDKPEVPSLARAKALSTITSGPTMDNKGKDGVSEKHSFDLDYIDERRGRHWTGAFKCHVLSIAEQMQFGQLMSRFRGNVPVVGLDLMTLQITEVMAQLTISLDEAPPWARGDALLEIKDAGVLMAIFEEVRNHEARFWGAEPDGSDEGDDEEPKGSD